MKPRIYCLAALLLAACAVSQKTAAPPPAETVAQTPPAPPELFSGPRIGRLIRLSTRNPAGFHEIINGNLYNTPKLRIGADLSFPSNTTQGEKTPAMIMIHGSGGTGENDLFYAQFLNDMGLAVMRLDSFSGRGVTSTVGQQDAVSEAMMVTDAFRALSFLSAHPDIDPERIGIIGWSKGGAVSLIAAWENLRRNALGSETSFALHAAFYPPCFVNISDLQLTGAPVRILIGADDRWTPAEPCRGLADALNKKGTFTELTIYPDSEHSFDRPNEAAEYPKGFNYVNCRFAVTPQGGLIDETTFKPIITPEDMGQVVAACATPGSSTAPNPEAAEDAREDLRAFLIDELFDGQEP